MDRDKKGQDRKVVFEFTASGKGKGGIGLYFYSAYGVNETRWHGSDIQYFEAGEAPAKYRMVIDTGKLDQKFRDIVRCRPFLVSDTGAAVTFSNVKFSPVPYPGNTNQ